MNIMYNDHCPKLKRSKSQILPTNGELCDVEIIDIPHEFLEKYDDFYLESNSVVGWKFIHKTSSGNFQVQFNCKGFGLVHQGIYRDLEVAKFAVALCEAIPNLRKTSRGARNFIEELIKYT